jgi:predicted CoA-binding protein
MQRDGYSDDEVRAILKNKSIAVIGISRDANKEAHIVPRFLMEKGYNIIPINPFADEILGKKVYKSIKDVDERIDVVDVFRPSDQLRPVVNDVVERNKARGDAGILWLQLGIYDKDAVDEAKRNGIKVIYNRCMMQEYRRLFYE